MAGRHYGPAGVDAPTQWAGVTTRRGPGTSGGGSRERAAGRGPEGQAERPRGEEAHRPARRRVLQEEPGHQRARATPADRAIALRTDSARPRSRSGVTAIRYPFTTESVEGTASPTGTSPTASTTAWGQTRNTAQPNQAQTSRISTAWTERTRRMAGERNEPTTTLAANTPVSRPMTPPESPRSAPMTTMQKSRPSAVKFNRPYRNAVVRRKGCRHVNVSPSAARWRAEPGSRSALLLEGHAHEQQRDRRARIREGVDEEGKGAPGFEERAAQRRPDDAHGRRPAALRARRFGQLLRRHDGSQRARLRGVEDGAADALDEGHARE